MTMQARRHTMWIVVLAAVLFAAAPSARAQKAQLKNIEDMTAFRAQIEAVRNQIDPVLESLNAIVEAANADPTGAYRSFARELGRMDQQIDTTRKAKAGMQKKGKALFQEWEKKAGAITNPEIKAAAEKNRDRLQELYGTIEPDVSAAKESGGLFVSDLKDLNAYFQVDLSAAGISSVASMITKCTGDGRTVQGLLDRVLATLDQVKVQMAPGGTGAKK